VIYPGRPPLPLDPDFDSDLDARGIIHLDLNVNQHENRRKLLDLRCRSGWQASQRVGRLCCSKRLHIRKTSVDTKRYPDYLETTLEDPLSYETHH